MMLLIPIPLSFLTSVLQLKLIYYFSVIISKGENMRVPFNEVFSDNGDGSYTPKSGIRIGGAIATGIRFWRGVPFSGVDIVQYAGRDLEVEPYLDGIVEIKGAY